LELRKTLLDIFVSDNETKYQQGVQYL